MVEPVTVRGVLVVAIAEEFVGSMEKLRGLEVGTNMQAWLLKNMHY